MFTGPMHDVRWEAAATLLPNGKVLVVGGYDGTNFLSSAELYDPAAGTWTTIHPLATARKSHTATLLPNGFVLVAGGYGLWARIADFAENWPKYSTVLRQAAGAVEGKIKGIEGQVSQIAPEQGASSAPAVRTEPSIARTLIFSGVRPLYALFLEVTFMPFLVFFMLAEKRELWHGTLQLFPASRRTQVKETLEDLRDVLRDYLAGMSIVTLVVIASSSLFFWVIGMEYPILTGIASGILNMVPYIGAVMAWLPAFLIALAKWKALGQFALIAVTLTAIHVLAINLVAPKLVGRRVRLNAVAITIALLFWGWVWGGMGLVLAIPITATLRVICDHTESWKPIGRWLSA